MLGTKFKKVFFPKQSSKILGIGMQETIGKCLSKFGLLLQMVTSLRGHYGLKFLVPKILNFPLESPSQIAPKFNSLVEQCRTKIQIQLEAGYGWEGFHVKICLQKCVEIE